MKKSLALAIIVLFGAVTAVAEPAAPRRFSNPLLTDVVQMSRAGLSDATIVAYVKARSARLGSDLTADDLIRLQQAGVQESVVRYIAGAAGIEGEPANNDQEMAYDSSGAVAAPVEPSYGEDEAYDYAYPYGYPYGYGYGYPYYPYWYAYSPFFSGAFIVGGGFGHRSFFHGGHFSGRSSGHFSGHTGGHSSGHSGGGHGHR